MSRARTRAQSTLRDCVEGIRAWLSGDGKWSALTCRFLTPGMEGGYLSRQDSKLRLGLVVCGALGFPNTVLNLIVDHGTISKQSLALIHFSSITWALIFLLFLWLASSQRATSKLGPARLEILLATTMFLVFPSWVITCPCWAEQFTGNDGESVCRSDSRLLLGIDAMVTIQHMAVRVRWWMMLPAEIAAIACYVIPILAYGSPEGPDTPMLLCLLIVLVVGSSLGKRTIEQHERNQFLSIITEKTLRVVAERQLELQPPSQPSLACESAPGSEAGETRAESVPHTTSSGAFFNTFAAGADGSETLESLVQRGLREHWIIEESELRLTGTKILGAGGFSIVLPGSLMETPVAVKVPNTNFKHTSRQLFDISNELKVLRKLRHPNIVGFYGAVVNVQRHRIILVLEMLSGPPLDEFISPRAGSQADSCFAAGLTGTSTCGHCLVGISRALLFLHTRSPRIVHGDLKANNILVELRSSGPHPKVLDFGLSRVLTQRALPLGGSLRWAAPEVIACSDSKPHPAADVFSFGRLAFFITTANQPLAGLSEKSIRRIARRCEVPPLEWPNKSADSESASGSLVERSIHLVECCSHIQPQDRATMPEIYSILHAWPECQRVLGEDGLTADPNLPWSLWDDIQLAITSQSPRLARTKGFKMLLRQRSDAVPDIPEEPPSAQPIPKQTPLASTCSECAFPGLPPTPYATIGTQILDVVLSNNFQKVGDYRCCAFHEAIRSVQHVCETFVNGRCLHNIYDQVSGHCAACGLMAYPDENGSTTCSFCDGSIIATSATLQSSRRSL